MQRTIQASPLKKIRYLCEIWELNYILVILSICTTDPPVKVDEEEPLIKEETILELDDNNHMSVENNLSDAAFSDDDEEETPVSK